jgi:sirohydrochlorin cobaltochelatase
MHGAPPTDFPHAELHEFFGLHARLHSAPPGQQPQLERRHAELDARMRNWPRTKDNDPFFSASQELALALAGAAGCPVELGFNEFCAPDLAVALDRAAARNPGEVVVVTPMMTAGGEHSEKDIPAALEQARQRHPGVLFRYAWPFATAEVARFLAEQL